MIFEFKDFFTGKIHQGFFKFGRYEEGKRIAIQIFAKEKENPQDFFQPFCFVTVNLPNHEITNKDFFGYIDVNNAPWLEGFLSENGFGLPTQRFATSGFCNYPEYFFDIKKMKYYRLEQVP